MRAFIAIDLPAEARHSLRALQQTLSVAFDRATVAHTMRWSPVESIHLTLRFLGETEEVAHQNLARTLAAVAHTIRPFRLTVGGLGCFPNFRRPSVVWTGVQGDMESLHALQSPIERAARDQGFEPETRPFSPHLTLGRLRREATPADLARAGDLVQKMAQEPALLAWGVAVPVDALIFFQSDLRPTGAVYTALDRFPLSVGG